ncbi:hypothetical protein [Streptomyces enissocaesilis]|uniref:Uncharacterized protein n=1 Tax=Streptomyces enissocaesilis TaxID=332589 RepID=A0ABP6JQB7_9ACTN
MLKAQLKNQTIDETDLEAIRMPNKAGISVHASYIAGALGERLEALDRTNAGIRQMLGEVKLSLVEFLRFIPLPNGPAWDLLVGYERPNFFESSAETDSHLAAPGIAGRREGREEMFARFGVRACSASTSWALSGRTTSPPSVGCVPWSASARWMRR